MVAPFVSLPTSGTGCAHSVDIDTAACGEAEQVHILAHCPWGIVALSSCAEHAPVARAAGNPLAEHIYGPACVDQSCWKAGR